MTGASADGRWFVRLMDHETDAGPSGWEIYDAMLGETEPVRVMDDEPGLTADLVLARWERERADDENLGDL